MNTIIKKISFALILAVAFFANWGSSIAEDTVNEYDSIYRYNALESKILFPDVGNVEEDFDVDTRFIAQSDPSVDQEEDPIVEEEENDEKTDIAKQLEEIAEKQSFSIEKINKAIDSITSQNKVKTFLIGNDLGILRFQLVQIKELINQLNYLKKESEGSDDEDSINNRIKFLKEEQTMVESFMAEQEKEFSLFGWFVKVL